MDVTQLNTELMATLKAIPALGGRIYDGYIPGKLETDASGFIRPYVLLLAGIPADLPAERDLTRLADTTVADWAPQTNCVGPTPTHARSCAQLVAQALTNARIGNHWLLPDPDGFRAATPIQDNQVAPARFYLPLPWRLTTN